MNYFVLMISFLLIILSFVKRDSRVLFFILFFWMWILFAFNSFNADYNMYAGVYNGTLFGQHIDIGFKFLCSFFNSMGLSYTVFMMVYSFVGLYLIGSTIYKYSRNKSFSAGLYFIFPFVFDVIQLRNFLAFAIVIYSLKFLNDFKFKNIVLYVFLILIAASIHSFAIVGLVIPFLIKYRINFFKVAFFELFIMLFIKTDFFISILYKFMSPSRINAYFISGLYSPGRKTLLMVTIISILSIIIFLLISKRMKEEKESKYMYIYNITFKLFILSLFLIPIYQFNTVLTRFPRSILPLLYICLSNVILDKKERPKSVLTMQTKTFISTIILFTIVTIWYEAFIFDIDNANNTIWAIINNNYILDVFKF